MKRLNMERPPEEEFLNFFFHVADFFLDSNSARSPSWLSTCNPLASVSPEHRAQRHGDHHHHT